jgi:hypothetical protein
MRRIVLASRRGFHRPAALAAVTEAVRGLNLPVSRG